MSTEFERPYGEAPYVQHRVRQTGFGFAVEKWDNGRFSINLPHQCDEWEIATQEEIGEAVKRLAAFIDEATVALDILVKAGWDAP